MSNRAERALSFSGLDHSTNQNRAALYRIVCKLVAELEENGVSIAASTSSVVDVIDYLHGVMGTTKGNDFALDQMRSDLQHAINREQRG